MARRIRFSLRAVFIMLTGVAVLLGICVWRIDVCKRRRSTARDLEKLGATLLDHSWRVDGSGRLVPDRSEHGIYLDECRCFGVPTEPTPLVEVDLTHCQVESFAFGRLRDFPTLSRLWLDRSDITDDELKAIGQLTMLAQLSLSDTSITSESFQYLCNLQQLRVLVLDGTGVSDRHLDKLNRLSKLEKLHLGRTKVTSKGISGLNMLRELRFVDLGQTNIDDSSSAWLLGLPKLEEVWLDGTSTSSALRSALRHRGVVCDK